MSFNGWLSRALGICLLSYTASSVALPKLALQGYIDETGAITILHGGNTADPYFALQALLMAHDNGMDVTIPAVRFAEWLVPHQKPDGTFDRFCKNASKKWVSCKTADADDSLLALWMRLMDALPEKTNKNEAWANSYVVSKKALDKLYQPSRGVYMVSPVYLHGLFMDNLEVWSHKAHAKKPNQVELDKFAQDIYKTFWQPASKQFLVSTQIEQQQQKPSFYPDAVAQVFPLLVGFPILPQSASLHYKNWMRQHRADWLQQHVTDYPWGLLAVLALRQGDVSSARCWLRETSSMRHSDRWAVTDEVALLILASRRIEPAGKSTDCK